MVARVVGVRPVIGGAMEWGSNQQPTGWAGCMPTPPTSAYFTHLACWWYCRCMVTLFPSDCPRVWQTIYYLVACHHRYVYVNGWMTDTKVIHWSTLRSSGTHKALYEYKAFADGAKLLDSSHSCHGAVWWSGDCHALTPPGPLTSISRQGRWTVLPRGRQSNCGTNSYNRCHHHPRDNSREVGILQHIHSCLVSLKKVYYFYPCGIV